MSYVPPQRRNKGAQDQSGSDQDRGGSGNQRGGWGNDRGGRRDDRNQGENRRFGWMKDDDRRGGNRGYDDRRGGDRGYDRRGGDRGYDRRGGDRGYDRRDDRGGSNNRRQDSRQDSRFSNQDSRFSNQDSRGESQGNGRWSNQDSRSQGSKKKGPTMERDERLEARLFTKKTVGIDFDKYNDINVDVSGSNPPAPIKHFAEGKFHEVLISNIDLAGYANPTPIQTHSIPITLSQRDLMACAQTGSGKTAAFLFPVLSLLLTTEGDSEQPPPSRGYRRKAYPSALILTPTRELALQISDEAQKFVYRTGLKAVAVYGGQHIGEQIRNINRGCDLVIATPGRLMDILERGVISLAMIKFLILDEADQMLDMGFERDIRRIVEENDMPPQRQTSMFSATFPTQIQRLAADFLKDHIFLAIGEVGSVGQNITQKCVFTATKFDKDRELINVLSQAEGRTIIFVETKRSADTIENQLLDQNINAVSIHGDRSQQEREHALQLFRDGRCMVLVATSVAARGLDIKDVRLVINFDLPSKFEDYVHRIGRTGRAGHKGNAVAFVNERSRNLPELYDLLKQAKQEIEPWFQSLVGTASGFRHGRGGRGGNNRKGPQRDFRSSGGNRDFRSSNNGPSRTRTNNYSNGYNSGPPASTPPPSSSSAQDFPSLGGSSSGFGGWGKSKQPEPEEEECNDAW